MEGRVINLHRNRELCMVTKQNKTNKQNCLEAQTLFVYLVNFASNGKAHEWLNDGQQK